MAYLKNFVSEDMLSSYKSHCIPYRRSYLFHGVPGAGKTSFIQAIADHLAGLPSFRLAAAPVPPRSPPLLAHSQQHAVNRLGLPPVDSPLPESLAAARRHSLRLASLAAARVAAARGTSRGPCHSPRLASLAAARVAAARVFAAARVTSRLVVDYARRQDGLETEKSQNEKGPDLVLPCAGLMAMGCLPPWPP